jgi:hypothetical protein
MISGISTDKQIFGDLDPLNMRGNDAAECYQVNGTTDGYTKRRMSM